MDIIGAGTWKLSDNNMLLLVYLMKDLFIAQRIELTTLVLYTCLVKPCPCRLDQREQKINPRKALLLPPSIFGLCVALARMDQVDFT